MKYLVLSDIHGNLEALEAALASSASFDSVLVLGDLVGYGADPNAVIDCVRGLDVASMIRGNHDKVASGLEGTDGFNQIARDAIEWTASTLTPDNLEWLKALPKGPVAVDETILICHGTPFDEDVYVFDDLDAIRALRSSDRTLCLYGHTHVPAVFRLEQSGTRGVAPDDDIDLIGPPRGEPFEFTFEANASYLVNCGAVGQPRDGDPRAAFGVVDTDARLVSIMRVEYDLAAAQAKILKAGLPEILARRLGMGR